MAFRVSPCLSRCRRIEACRRPDDEQERIDADGSGSGVCRTAARRFRLREADRTVSVSCHPVCLMGTGGNRPGIRQSVLTRQLPTCAVPQSVPRLTTVYMASTGDTTPDD